MIPESLQHFIRMGGYGWYVWLAYGMALVVLSINIVLPLYGFRRLWKTLRRSSQFLR